MTNRIEGNKNNESRVNLKDIIWRLTFCKLFLHFVYKQTEANIQLFPKIGVSKHLGD